MSDPSIPDAAADAPATPKKRGFLSKILIVALLLAAAAWSGRAVMLAISTEKTDDAYVVGHVHRLGAGVGGTLLEVLADDNQQVKCGQLLARIDPLEFEILEKQAVAANEQAKAAELQAEAMAAQTRAADLQADASITLAEAEIQQGVSRLQLAHITLDRNESLLSGGGRAISQAEADQARSEVAAATAIVAGGKAKLASAQAGKTAACSNIRAAEARVVAAKADVDASQATICDARRQLELTRITAPSDGRVGAKNAETGNRVQIGQSLYAVVEEDCWIVGNFKETQLEKMRIGQTVDITVDALGGRHFTGKVDSFSPSTGAQFALLPPDNSTGNFTKVVQRVPVKITIDPESLRGSENLLKPGLSTVVRVNLK